jgi:uncharacterized protein
MNKDDAPDFAELAAALRALNAGISAADLHGTLCGFLSAGGHSIPLFLESVALDQISSANADAHAIVARLFQHSQTQLDDAEFDFSPLLPEAERPVAERTEALLQWCQGFVGGLGLGGFKDERALSKDGSEVLHDLIEISRTEVSLDADEEVDEEALTELIEFARIGSLLLREDLRAPQPRAKARSA